MNIRTKLTLGFLTVLLLLLALGGYASWAVRHLDATERRIRQTNFYSVEMGQQMLRALDQLAEPNSSPVGLTTFRRALTRAGSNITEPGEQALIDSLTQEFARYQRLRYTAAGAAQPLVLQLLRQQTHRLVELNIEALKAKSRVADRAASRAVQTVLALAVLAALLTLGLVRGVPEAVDNSLHSLRLAIRHATQHDFTTTIPVESHDELGLVARAFNQMLVELQDFRSSTISAQILERNRLASVVNSLDEGLLLLDQHGRIILANPVICRLLGLAGELLIGRPAADIAVRNERLRAILEPLNAPNRHQAAQEVPVLSFTQRGEETYYRLWVHDIVAYNEAEEQMQFAGHILSLRNVSEFKKLDQMKSNFLATVSHELKTPLASISLSSKLLLHERTDAAERERIVAGIRQETQRLQRMVAELIDVSRLEAGAGIQLDVRPTRLADVVHYATDTVQAQLDDKHVRLDLQLPADLPAVRADAEKTTWVLINLLANAVRYSPEGGCLRVQAEAQPDCVQLSVRDCGPGIAPEYHEQIFQRFGQAPDQGRHRGSSGLGLSISREFIAAQGGRLWVESAVGEGSTFRFTLPLA
ncbi:cell wall metabolism sensor histidine kinase WalK [Hymenobacter busanensis]|uniref:histidine kinase n=1 Tax=Hymenobacter busanensis TaxID=2607656 RepID=A0A7L4ZTR5_9BACT|nr:ATP-binding protein [Hymenobacter busanensis]KAA9339886.1 cell wall metabolism sensor histidine kinase WalK [Hymenobacter busanensis]QHJ06357.1 HAMP domain-containing protein [Hymenobacter busanensis]